MNFKKIIAVGAIVVISGVLPTITAFADNVSNNLDNTVDASLEVMNLTAPNSGAVVYKTLPTNGDGDNGCNLGSGESVTFNVITGNSLVATVSPSTVTFSGPGCSGTQSVTVTGVGAGSTTITLTQGANNTGGTYSLTPAAFTVNVAAITDTTKPVITGTRLPLANVNGWNNTNIAVSFTCADELGGSGVNVNTVAGDNMTLTGEGAGQSVSSDGVCTDNAGNVALTPVTVNGINIDKTNPVVSITGNPADPSNVTSPVFSYGITEAHLQTVTCKIDATPVACGNTTATITGPLSDGPHLFEVTATDLAGNTGSDSFAWTIDATAPVVIIDTYPPNPTNTTSGTFEYTIAEANPSTTTCTIDGTDANVDSCTMTSATFSGLSNGSHTFLVSHTDLAGNTGSDSYMWIVDTMPPVITAMVIPPPNGNGWNKTDVVVSFACTDEVGGSGVNINTAAGTTLTAEGTGQSVTNTGTCTDNAGNVASPVTINNINIDKTLPTVSSANAGGSYLQGQSVPVSFSCDDALSTIDTCQGPAGLVDTTTGGNHTFNVTATDKAGNLYVKTVQYHVYTLADVFKGLFNPITVSSKDFQKNSTLPVKFALNGGFGNFFGGNAQLYVKDDTSAGAWTAAVSSGGSNVLNSFRYDAAAGQYIFNLSTKMPMFVAGHTYSFRVVMFGIPYTPIQTAIIKVGK
jgi:hypothetical protein